MNALYAFVVANGCPAFCALRKFISVVHTAPWISTSFPPGDRQRRLPTFLCLLILVFSCQDEVRSRQRWCHFRDREGHHRQLDRLVAEDHGTQGLLNLAHLLSSFSH